MDKNAKSGSFGGYKMPNKEGIANINYLQEVTEKDTNKDSISIALSIKNQQKVK
ncbi:hypothetical protein [Pelosinus baikalensis]|uniref:Uncharacterized protein n=1 Tax=Pelosinus baikalensis TaxID=2892015 RepID=A0ABS8I1L5_9FIRM|nr:hypothetical protein [Pelosinus baikalensis]MCC5468444.1 hypothetical protein [Pelosinus baikalensis]